MMLCRAWQSLTVLLALSRASAQQTTRQQWPTHTADQHSKQQWLKDVLAEDSNPANIVVILTDDQDAMMDSTSYMPRLKEHIIDQGTHYANHFTTTAICCPSRVSLWTGKQPHNTNVTDVSPPWGGYPKFISQGLNDDYLPVWLQEAGYATYYTGKMFNAHTVDNYDSPYLAGWTSNNFLLDPGTYSYLNPIFQKDHDPPIHHENEHTTDLIQKHAADLISKAVSSDKPFFVAVAPVAPHSNIDANDDKPRRMTEPIPLKRHAHLFPEAQVPRTSNFNPIDASGASWISDLPRLNESSVERLDAFHRQRLRALQGVDELVEQVILQLDRAGVLDNTYVIYTSDNGFHLGQHRLPPGKTCGFEEDIRVPFFIRGPGVPKGATEQAVTGHIDVVPTIHSIARIKLRDDFDGVPLPLKPRQPKHRGREPKEHVAVEYWGKAIAEGDMGGFDGEGQNAMLNNTYKAIRLRSATQDLYYAVWCSNEHELYDLRVDPGQMHNLYSTEPLSKGGSKHFRHRLISRLDSLMLVMKSCKGKTCREPWSVLHPDGNVRTLEEAMNQKFDEFYEAQARVSFSQCELGYIISSEGPQTGYEYRETLGWSEWT